MFRRLLGRLYLRIFLAIVVALFCLAVLVGLSFRFIVERSVPKQEEFSALAGELAAEVLAGKLTSRAQTEEVLQHWHVRARVDLALFDSNQRLIASAGRELPAPEVGQVGWLWREGGPPRFVALLPSGEHLVLHRAPPHGGWGPRAWPAWLAALAALTLAIAAGAYPVVRRLTAQLESLQQAVQAMGQGDLKQRVEVRGDDEVAHLAISFNESAQHIETLVQAHRDLLAHTSHELRSPLARLKLALELQQTAPKPERSIEIARNIVELDQLIEALLLHSRLDTQGLIAAGISLAFDLVALWQEELGRWEASTVTSPELFRVQARWPIQAVMIKGDADLLRRLLRNLLDNAAKYGCTARGVLELDIELLVLQGRVMLRVMDRGPGVDPGYAEQIFMPFVRAPRLATQPSPGLQSSPSGSGLGLALVRRIARLHAGEARCLPREGAGAMFEVVLPF